MGKYSVNHVIGGVLKAFRTTWQSQKTEIASGLCPSQWQEGTYFTEHLQILTRNYRHRL